jgi:putrescine transport system substrate-binding protein
MRTLALSLLCLALVCCSRVSAEEEAVVQIYNWNDYFAEDTLDRFQAATGVKPELDLYDSNEILEAKLLAGKSGYDLVFPTARPFGARHVKAGLYAKLDKSKLPLWKNLDPEILKALTDIDPGNQHLVPYMWGTSGLGINEDKVKAILGDAPLNTWALVFDPATAEKLAACGITLLDDPTNVFSAVLAYLGKDPNSLAPADLEAAQAVLKRIHPYVKYFHSSQYQSDLANGDVCVSHGYSGDIIQAQTRAEESGNNVRIDYLIPREGAPLWVDVMAIPKDAPHPAEAHRLINFLLEGEVIAAVSNFVFYANANQASTRYLNEALRNDPGVYPPPAVRKWLSLPPIRSDSEIRKLNRLWTRTKANR